MSRTAKSKTLWGGAVVVASSVLLLYGCESAPLNTADPKAATPPGVPGSAVTQPEKPGYDLSFFTGFLGGFGNPVPPPKPTPVPPPNPAPVPTPVPGPVATPAPTGGGGGNTTGGGGDTTGGGFAALAGLNATQLATFQRGQFQFKRTWSENNGLGPIFNANGCAACHGGGGTGGPGDRFAVRMAVVDKTDPNAMRDSYGFDTLMDLGGPLQQLDGLHGTRERAPLQSELDAYQLANAAKGFHVGRDLITVTRKTPMVAGDGLLEAIPDQSLRTRYIVENGTHPFGIKAKLNGGTPGVQNSIGRLGWKAHAPNDQDFTADAAVQEVGLSNPLNPVQMMPNAPGVPVALGSTDLSQSMFDDLVAFQEMLAPPAPVKGNAAGEAAFNQAGCAACHYSGYTTASSYFELSPRLQEYSGALTNKSVKCYSDLMLHDMGVGLADGFKMGDALGSDWKTAPLWGLHLKHSYLHDGRATTLDAAIQAHFSAGSEANQVINNYNALSASDKAALLDFVGNL